MKEIGLPIALAIIMFGMGLGLTVADFKRVFSRPKAFLTGAVLQIVSLPLFAFLVVSVFPLSAAFAVGFMILAACPGGVTSNILTYISRGDVCGNSPLKFLAKIGLVQLRIQNPYARASRALGFY